MIGELLTGWKLIKKLGEGGTGETYLAEREGTGEKAAAKVLFAPASSDRALLDKLFAEANAASKVNHVGMTDVYACGVHGNGRAYLVMELLEGKTLTDALIELGAVTDIDSFADIAWQLATLLAAAHAANLVHGGLKPDGIFLTFPPFQAPRPLVKVLDFGMAKFSTSIRHSQTGSLLGAPLYMSPEIGRGLGKVDQRADIYSLGCILFEMLCGRPPFVREGKGELIIAHATEPPPSVASLEPSVPQAIDNLIGRMLTKNPAVRPQTMAEVAGVLEKFFKCPAPGAGAPVGAAAPPVPSAALAPAAPAPPMAATPIPASASAVSHIAEPPSRPHRRHDPTALLTPESAVVEAGFSTVPPSGQTWAARVHRETAILDSPSQPWERGRDQGPEPRVRARVPAAKPRRAPRAGMRAGGPGPRQTSGLNLPIVIATAAIVLAIGASILLLRGKRRSAPPRPSPPSTQPAPEPFRPPAPLPAPSLATPPPLPPEPTGTDKDLGPRPARATSSDAAKGPSPGARKPARRW